jgi:LAO/AO transport system kinase
MIDIDAVLNGSRLAFSRMLTQIENDTEEGQKALMGLFPHTGRAILIGVTGAPGTGKSSLVNQIAFHFRNPTDGSEAKTVGIIAVDPSSPFSGGAILGDRIRMKSLSGDKGVYIRSMASRGSLGGLANMTVGIVHAFDAAGYDVIIVETVGAGQAEVDIARLAHTTLVVEAPGLGDDIQAIKAGIMEIADIMVVNKADRPGVEHTERALKNMLQLAHPQMRLSFVNNHHDENIDDSDKSQIWETPVMKTIATTGEGVPELMEKLAEHREYLKESGDLAYKLKNQISFELKHKLKSEMLIRFNQKIDDGFYQEVFNRVLTREISPQEAVDLLLNIDM